MVALYSTLEPKSPLTGGGVIRCQGYFLHQGAFLITSVACEQPFLLEWGLQVPYRAPPFGLGNRPITIQKEW